MVEELICFRNLEDEELLFAMSDLMDKYTKGSFSNINSQDKALLYECMSELVEFAGRGGFYGNLWHDYLAYLLVNSENTYSLACEMKGQVEGTINDLVLHDMEVFRKFFDYDFTELFECFGAQNFEKLFDYKAGNSDSKIYNRRIRDRICRLACDLEKAADEKAMKDCLTLFYKEYGVGKFGLHKAFRVGHSSDSLNTEYSGVTIEPIKNIRHVKLDDLVGYEIAKKKLVDNTEAFLAGRPANNCLLYGDAGTGKSTCIKALANTYFDKGLRIIEVYKHQFKDLNDVIAQIKGRSYRFIIYMDDLSFEDFETEYKYLKAVIEGGLEKKPENVLIYATSNRRHLIKESFKDKKSLSDDGDIHASDTVQEKISLSDRFGVSIYFGKPDPKQFKEIVTTLALRNGIRMPEDELLAQASKWELHHGGLSGRCAQQFIDYLLGQEA
ncbi:hypothetical protein SAMN02745229_00942 [Butyrivibrio fibrisolvens DSM 3071]|uniref:AAA+ ATPase domain-containing protein n=2 Tax=Butyrivibrio fibrisolvens TaxID=831 RepID=A0A1M5W822_BUTFI|nr:ATP-binding protein [Butyrivibrio fibrisolvens]SHH83578.1 hypothetical protein SAMN02745229_00942 [Butyrivibrio fibrisolvens DSM 3071]